MTRTFTVSSHEGYQARAFADDPKKVGQSTERGLQSVARAAKREAERPPPSLWDKFLGPFYSPAQAAARLGDATEAEVVRMAEAGLVVGMRTADNEWVFPSFQFDGRDLQVHLASAFRAVRASGVDDWTAGGWLMARHLELEGKTAKEWLLSDEDPAELLRLAREAASRFSR